MLRSALALCLPLALTAARPPRAAHPQVHQPRIRYAVILIRVPLPDSIPATDSARAEAFILPRARMLMRLLAMTGAPPDSGHVVFVRDDTSGATPEPIRRSTDD